VGDVSECQPPISEMPGKLLLAHQIEHVGEASSILF
jgi:hypothetical protein